MNVSPVGHSHERETQVRWRRQGSMRAFTGWVAPLLLLLLLSCSSLLSSSNASLRQTNASDPNPGSVEQVSRFCTVGDTESCGMDSHTCSSYLLTHCTAGHGQSCRATTDGEDTTEGIGLVRTVGEVNDEYIVRFKEYRHSSEFKLALEQKLEHNDRAWQWLERNNPASAFPTDFALLRIKRSQHEDVLEALKKLEFVKDVSPQMRFTRSLTSEKSEDEHEGSEVAHEQFKPKDKEEFLESKPPGRLHTKLSFESGIEDVVSPVFSNVSLDHGRKLLLQVLPDFCPFDRTQWTMVIPS